MEMDNDILKLQEMIDNSRNTVFFGGAGVSTESGIPDFRSTDGLYNQKYKFPPETILSHTFFTENTDEFYRFYFDKMIYTSAKPNKAHIKLAEMEKAGKLKAVITQNIDGLHQAAGSLNVYELHGSVHRNYCSRCGRFYALDEILKCKGGIPRCDCGGIIKPDVVLYEEGLNDETVEKAVNALSRAELVIVGGTSLNVYPAAGFLTYAKAPIFLINKSKTPFDGYAKLVINQPIGEVLGEIKV